jgi:plastocyanin
MATVSFKTPRKDPTLRKLLLLAALIAAVLTIPALAAAATKSTTLQDDFFTKGKITVKKGTTVHWTWQTQDSHTVTELNGKFSSTETTHGNFKHRFTKRGKFTVYCLVHPEEMRQTVVVK